MVRSRARSRIHRVDRTRPPPGCRGKGCSTRGPQAQAWNQMSAERRDPILDYLPSDSGLAERLTFEDRLRLCSHHFPGHADMGLRCAYLGLWGAGAHQYHHADWVRGHLLAHNASRGFAAAGRKRVVPFSIGGGISRWAEALFCGIYSVFSWRRYHRWGRVPRVLLANKDGLTLSYLGWFWMRRKHWPAGEITAIELRPVRGNLTWWRTAADLRILRQKRMPLSFRLSTSDSQLPGQITARIRSLLGHGP